MRTDELTRWMNESDISSAPDLARITALGRRRRLRGRLVVAGAGVCVLAAVSSPFVVAAQSDRPTGVDPATAPSAAVTTFTPSAVVAPEDRPAQPVGRVITNLNKFYLSSGSSSVGLMSVWGERPTGDAPALHYGWKSESDGVVHNVGTLVESGDLTDGVQVRVVPSAGADLAEPTFVVTYPIAPGTKRERYALSVEGSPSNVNILTKYDVIPGYVTFTFSPLLPSGGVPDLDFIGLTGPDGLEVGVDVHHDDKAWSTSPAEQR